ncbi:MAG: 16S rRNA (cytosine(1402)-N(4))-methyltransferase RsmH [Phycisphaerae bacterium]|nr:16S rRNA (cytosine(1402)-N(4))-methyltransferase RsmH [Phycisphaerae bacterium]
MPHGDQDEGRDAGRHVSVLPKEVPALLVPPGRTPRRILDCTLGAGGHAKALLELAGTDARLVGMDADESNVILARRTLASHRGRVRLFHANFADAREVLREAGWDHCDALLADLGFASNQVDDPRRGLSFQQSGPLDMRLDRHSPRTAADIVNQVGEKDLADLIYTFGEERYSRRIARAIVSARRAGRIERTTDLAEIVGRALPAPVRRTRRGIHPAARTFQALRIAVNNELENLDALLELLPDALCPGGRAAIISFHSLEDRRVKRCFAALEKIEKATVLTKKPITPSRAELASNPRSRSAKLRGIEIR